MSNKLVPPRLHKLLMDAAKDLECGAYTTAEEIAEKMVQRRDWLHVYGLDEIKLRDLVIEKLLEEQR